MATSSGPCGDSEEKNRIAAAISSSADSVIVLTSKAVVSCYSLRDMRSGSDMNLHRRFTSSPDGNLANPVSLMYKRKLLFAGSMDGDARVWDMKDGVPTDDINLDSTLARACRKEIS